MRLYTKVWALFLLLFMPAAMGIAASVERGKPTTTLISDVEVVLGSTTTISYRENRRIGVDGVGLLPF